MIDHSLLHKAQALGLLRHVDLAIVDFIERHQNQPATKLSPAIALAIALISRQSAQGHVCIDLEQMYAAPDTLLGISEASWVAEEAQQDKQALLNQLESLFLDISITQWLDQWQQCEAVGWVSTSDDANGDTNNPLVVDSRSGKCLLFMSRYWHNEQRIYQFVAQQCCHILPIPPAAKGLLAQLFAKPASAESTPNLASNLTPDWQKIAIAVAIRQGFSIITGGPGTGKTTTVLKLLCLLQALRLEQQQTPWYIALTAPTGKAASRLNESIGANLAAITMPANAAFDSQTLRAAIPTQVTTLHRLLGSQPDSRHFRHHENNPIHADIVVVDEASMIDLDTMAALVRALPKHARLIIIGDKDQLASVEAGSVLGDLCSHLSNNDTHGHYGMPTLAAIEQITGYRLADEFHDAESSAIAQATCMLRQSHRFQANGAIARLAKLINADSASVAISTQTTLDKTMVTSFLDLVSTEQQAAVAESRPPQLQTFYQPDTLASDPSSRMSSAMSPTLSQAIVAGYRGWLSLAANTVDTQDQTAWAQQILQARSQFQVLVAVNEGPQGLHAVNKLIEQTLAKANLIDKNLPDPSDITNDIRAHPDSGQTWYHGRPVIVVRNDYSLNLMNGDMGICLRYVDPKTQTARLRVLFNDTKGGIRWVLPSRLHYVATAFAMTVHKSQGSEFDHAMLMLPNRSNPVLSKALMYTGITRARRCFSLVYGNNHVLEEAMTNGIERASGLSYFLSLPSHP